MQSPITILYSCWWWRLPCVIAKNMQSLAQASSDNRMYNTIQHSTFGVLMWKMCLPFPSAYFLFFSQLFVYKHIINILGYMYVYILPTILQSFDIQKIIRRVKVVEDTFSSYLYIWLLNILKCVNFIKNVQFDTFHFFFKFFYLNVRYLICFFYHLFIFIIDFAIFFPRKVKLYTRYKANDHFLVFFSHFDVANRD